MLEDELAELGGWLKFYAVTKILSGLIAGAILVPVLGDGTSLIDYIPMLGVITKLAAGTGIMARDEKAIVAVGIEMIVNLLVLGCTANLAGPEFFVPALMVQLAIAYAWFAYFRRSRRVRLVLGRNLLGRREVMA